jgi:hypothetical protein
LNKHNKQLAQRLALVEQRLRQGATASRSRSQGAFGQAHPPV